jgi:hypothetical protein
MMDSIGLDWRAGIFILLAIAAIYVVVMLLQLAKIRRKRQVDSGMDLLQEPVTGSYAEPAAIDTVQPAQTFASALNRPDQTPAPAFEWEEVKDLFGEPATAADAASTAEQVPQPEGQGGQGGFGEHLAEHLARAEMEMEVQRLRADIVRMRAEMNELRLARRVSPQYAEATELAQRGLPAQAVADRMGISLAEAELVHALSRGDKNFAEGEEHGANEYAANGGSGQFDNRRPG